MILWWIVAWVWLWIDVEFKMVQARGKSHQHEWNKPHLRCSDKDHHAVSGTMDLCEGRRTVCWNKNKIDM